VLPNAPTDRDQTDADANVREQIDRSLHRIGDGEIGVLALFQCANEKNSAQEPDDLHDRLHDYEIAYDLCTQERAANDRRRALLHSRRQDGIEETHGAFNCSTEPWAARVPRPILARRAAKMTISMAETSPRTRLEA